VPSWSPAAFWEPIAAATQVYWSALADRADTTAVLGVEELSSPPIVPRPPCAVPPGIPPGVWPWTVPPGAWPGAPRIPPPGPPVAPATDGPASTIEPEWPVDTVWTE